jgi:hypothetical protein
MERKLRRDMSAKEALAYVQERIRSQRASKTKFSCPACRANAWAKPDTLLLCGKCWKSKHRPVTMLVEVEAK